MSKASEWAKREHRRLVALEEARARIDAEIDRGDSPTVFMRDRSPLASVVHAEGHPRLNLTTYSGGNVWLTAEEALAFARWILDVFGDSAPEGT